METLLDHRVTLNELQRIQDYEEWSLDHYKFMVSVTVNCQKSRDCFYRRIAELYDLRGNAAKAAEYRAKIKDRSVLKPYVFEDWCGPGKQSDFEPAPKTERLAA